MYKLAFVWLLVFFETILNAQDLMNSRQWVEQAEFYLFNHEYAKAAKIYDNLLENDLSNTNISFHLSLCYLNLSEENKKAIYYLKKIFSNSTIGDYDRQNDYFIYLGKLYHIDHAEETNVKDSTGFKFDPYKPYNNIAISGDGKKLIFLSGQQSENKIFCIVKTRNSWSKATDITAQLGSGGDCFPSSLNYNGSKLYVTKYNNFESDIYGSNFNGKTWSGIRKLNGNINTSYWDTHASESPDGQVLYFASNRPGGFGGMDIYYAFKDAGGDWGKPVNAGIRINTYLNDDYPLITNGGATLIYSSQGFKKGRDGFDIYYCNNVNGGVWSAPVNIGYPVNTSDDDQSYVPLTEESQAYFNLSLLDLKKEEKQAATKSLILKGQLFPILKGRDFSGVSAQITDNSSKSVINSLSASADGKFTISLKQGDFTIKFFYADNMLKTANVFVPFLTRNDSSALLIEASLPELSVKNMPEGNKNIGNQEIQSLTKDSLLRNGVYTNVALNISNPELLTIQLCASKIFINNVKLNNRESVFVFRAKDGYYRYVTGTFANEAEALPILKKAKDGGYKDSFIAKWVKFSDQERVYKK
jgi:tetratricopeptide (TPR) repeat protein